MRAETIGGVTFDGSGASGAFGGLSFEDGAHHQTWDGFRFANMTAVYTGIIEVGGYTPRRTPHHITIRNMTVLGMHGSSHDRERQFLDHGMYLAHAAGTGPHDILVEDFTVDGPATSPAPSTSITAMPPTPAPTK